MVESLETLATFTDAAERAKTVRDLMAVILELSKNLGFSRCRLYQLDRTEPALVGAMQYGLTDAHCNMFEGVKINLDKDSPITARLTNAGPLVVDGRSQPQSFLALVQAHVAWIDIPLVHQRTLFGKIAVDRNSPEPDFTQDELTVFKIASTIAAHRWHVLETYSPPTNPAECIMHFKRTHVLILGKDTGEELKILRCIQKITCEFGYIAEIVKDAPEIPEMANEDKVRALADSSRFVLLENSYAAGQIVEMKILATNRITTAILRRSDLGSSWMVADYDIDYSFMREFVYTDGTLLDAVHQACEWAAAHVSERVRQLAQRYPWRAQGVPLINDT